MGRRPCCAKEGLNRGAWTAHEDRVLTEYIKVHGEGSWRNLPKRAGLKRCGKSCRLRWLNYLRPDIKRGNISVDEEELIIRLHKLLGNRWALIAGRIPRRTDNEIKNYWNTNLCKKVKACNKFKVPYKHLNSAENDTKWPTKIEQCPKINEGSILSDSKLGSNQVVIRTKATRCTKVLIDHQQQSHVTQILRDRSGLNSIGQECNISTTTVPENNNLYNTLFARYDQDNDFIMDFNAEGFYLSDFLNLDYLSDHNMSNTNYDHEIKSDILSLDEKELRFSSDDQEILLQEWNEKDSHNNVDHESSSNFDHQIIPTFQSLANINSLIHGDEQWLLR